MCLPAEFLKYDSIWQQNNSQKLFHLPRQTFKNNYAEREQVVPGADKDQRGNFLINSIDQINQRIIINSNFTPKPFVVSAVATAVHEPTVYLIEAEREADTD